MKMDYKDKLARNIKLFYFVDFFVHLSFILPIWVAFYTRVATFTEVAFFHALAQGLTIILELPTGALADLIGRKKTIILGYALSTIAFIYLSFAVHSSMVLIAFAMRGIAEAFVSGADSALFYDTLKELGRVEELPKIAARSGLLIRIALALGTLAGGYLYTLWVGLPYFLVGVALFIVVILFLFMIEPHLDSEKFTLKSYVEQTKEGIKQLFKDAHTKKLSIYYLLVAGITWACLIYFNQPFAKDAGLTETEMSWVFSGMYLLIAFVMLYITHHRGIVTRERVIFGIPILMMVGLLPGIIATKWMVLPMAFLVTFAGGSRFTFLDKYTNDEFDSKYRATAGSALNMLVSLFTLILIGASGIVQDMFSTKIIYTFLGFITLLFVIPSSISLVREHRKINS